MRLFKRKATEQEVINIRKENQKLLGRIENIEYSLNNPPKFKVGDIVRFRYSDGEKFIGVVSENNKIAQTGWTFTCERFYTIIVDCNDIHRDIPEDRIKFPKTKKS